MASNVSEELFPRGSGILLHITSLSGRFGIGDLGPSAYAFVDYLEKAGQTYWQVLPLGPTGYADSPYQCLSAFAGNANLIGLENLEWLSEDDLRDAPAFPEHRVDYQAVNEYHNEKLSLAYQRYISKATSAQRNEFAVWCKNNRTWLDDYSVFAAMKAANGNNAWSNWAEGRDYTDTNAQVAARQTYAERIAEQRFRQWTFYTQWMALKRYANDHGISIIGDLPIFVAHDSADVWAHRDMFFMDEEGNPTVVAGVPPDYFSPTGQLWGNPLYRWWTDEAKQRKNEPLYAWWLKRVSVALEMFDYIRIDHFRGFHEYYEIPADHPTAEFGTWVDGPRDLFFDAIGPERKQRIIAEDLGANMEEVIRWRETLGMPGMCILQFAFDDNDSTFLPHNYKHLSVVYTGTHDNNTTVGWWHEEATEYQREHFQRYVGVGEIVWPAWEMIRLGMRSVARIFIVPMQDILGLGSSERMNTPGTSWGNWGWRCPADVVSGDPLNTPLSEMTELYGRLRKMPNNHESA
ncbi:MAG: 4-alpha-glucanotransferase [Anaerolineae bacterium]|nr:4-alpha-glucanotransferase [Anaerolineae bacterium]